MRLCFLLTKDPTSEQVGATAMARELIASVRALHDVVVVCWSTDPERVDTDGVIRLPKPNVSPVRTGIRALRTGRSLLHARYDDPALRAAIDAVAADAFVAVHHYAAEAFLRSSHRDAPLYVVNVVPEAPVWRTSRGWIGRRQAGAIERDEARILRRAVAVGSYDREDAADAARRGAARSVWLELTLPAREALNVRATPPRLAVLGNRTWAPNERAWQRMLALWPEISRDLPEAELVAIGQPHGRAPRSLPAGVRDLGFVHDLPGALATCRALAAPIDVGGGVRVKLLEAASVGLPVVATAPAAGSLTELLGIEPVADDLGFIAACRRLLSAPEHAAAQGAQLHAANVAHRASGRADGSVKAWLG